MEHLNSFNEKNRACYYVDDILILWAVNDGQPGDTEETMASQVSDSLDHMMKAHHISKLDILSLETCWWLNKAAKVDFQTFYKSTEWV